MYDGRVYSVLVVSGSERFAAGMKQLLPDSMYSPVRILSSASHAKRAMLESQYDFVIINAPLPDENGTRLAIDAVRDRGCVCLLLVSAEAFNTVHMKVVDYGVFTLARPVNTSILNTALNWMAAARERLRSQEKKAVSLEEKMEEIRVINRAKWLLIEHLSMAEEDAHHYIERQAMNRCVTKREVADGIIRTYS